MKKPVAINPDNRRLRWILGLWLLALLIGLALLLLWIPAAASDCNEPGDCAAAANTARSPIVPIAGAAAGAAAAAAVGSATAGAGTATAGAGSGGPPAGSGPGAGWVTDQKVVSGQEAIDRLVDMGANHDGDCVLAPSGLSSMPAGVRGVAWTGTRPHPTDPNKRCLDPDQTAITVDWPHPPGPTEQTWIEPSGSPDQRITDIEQGLDDLGFPSPGRVTTDTGETFVRAPDNLPDDVAGIAHGTRTVTDPNTGETVVVINPDMPVAVDHWPKQPAPTPVPTLAPTPTPPPPSPSPSPTSPPPSPTPPPSLPPPTPAPTTPPATTAPPPPTPAPQQKPPKKTYIFGMTPLLGIEGGELVVGMLLCVRIRGIHGGSGQGYLIYRGAGTGVGTPVSVWGPGSEGQVVATTPMTVAQFAGGGSVGGIGIAIPGIVRPQGIGASASTIIFFCGPLPNVYWVPWGWATGAGAGFSATLGYWTFHQTAEQAMVTILDDITHGSLDQTIGKQQLAQYMAQIRQWITGP